MRFILSFLLSVVFTISALSQTEDLADSYFKEGDYGKALLSYQKLYEKEKKQKYFLQIINSYRQLDQLDQAEALLLEKLVKSKSITYTIELGYNYQLKNDTLNANLNYEKAINKVKENPAYTYSAARRFEEHVLLDQAARTYELGMQLKPNSNYTIQLARIYGEQARFEEMFNSYLGYVERKPNYIDNVKRIFSQFITEDKTQENNISLRKALLKRIQSNPNLLWNQLLSWLFIQQKEYNKAFAQEKAIYKRELLSLESVVDLAIITIDEQENEIARNVLEFVINNSQEAEMILDAHQLQLTLDTKSAVDKKDYKTIDERYQQLFQEFGRGQQTLNLQIAYGHFLAFYKNDTKNAITFLKEILKVELAPLEESKVKLELGDILVFEEKFNEALIYYSQIQYKVKNSVLSQQARFKVAKTSYYKGDFDWAESQLKILKKSTSQLTANDALDLKLLISDNRNEDSLQTALKLYSKADLLAFQNRTDESINLLDQVLEAHKTETIVDQALLKQAQLFEKKKDYLKAEANYLRIITDFKDDILVDDAYYHLGELYANELEQPEKAKEFYEKIIFEHADSIYFVEARKKFRLLRGDDIN